MISLEFEEVEGCVMGDESWVWFGRWRIVVVINLRLKIVFREWFVWYLGDLVVF